MAVIHYRDLSKIRKRFKDKTIVFCSGTFDLTHAGHALFFEDCKRQGDILVVAVGSDVSIKEVKGRTRPVLNQSLRLKMVDSLKPVDFCFMGPNPQRGRPLSVNDYFFKNLRPDLYVVNDDAFDMRSRKEAAEKYGVKLMMLRRSCPKSFEKISTTKIIDKILNQ